MKKFWITVGILVFCAGLGWGDAYTFQPTTGNWNVLANWYNDTASSAATVVPGAGDTATIPSSRTATLVGPVSINSVIIDGTLDLGSSVLTVTGTITNNGTITLAGVGTQIAVTPPTIGGTGLVNFNAAGATLAGITSFGGDVEINDGARNAGALISVVGNLDIAGGASLDLAGYTLSAAAISNDGTITLAGSTGQTVNPATIGGTGTVNFNAAGTTLAGITNFDGNLTISAGTRTAIATTSVGGNLIVNTSLNMNSNNLTVSGNIINTGPISNIALLTLNGGTAQTINFGSAVTVGSLEKSGAGTATLSQNLTVSGGVTLTAGSLALTGSAALNVGTQLNMGANTELKLNNGGSIANAGTRNTSSTIEFTGGTGFAGLSTFENLVISGGTHAGTPTVNGNLSLSNAGRLEATGALNVTGALSMAGTSYLQMADGGSFGSVGTLGSGTTIEFSGGTGFAGLGTFENLVISGGTHNGTPAVNGDLSLSGSGRLEATGALNVTGALSMAGTSYLQMAAGGSFGSVGTLASTATIDFSGGTTSGATALAGITSFDGNLTISGGTHTVSAGNVSVSGNLTNSAGLTLNGYGITPLSGTLDNTGGTITFTSGTEPIGGKTTVDGTAVFLAGGTLNGITNFANLTLSGGDHSVSAVTTVNGTLNITTGSLTLTGLATLNGVTRLDMGANTELKLNNGGSIADAGTRNASSTIEFAGGTTSGAMALAGITSFGNLTVSDGTHTLGSGITASGSVMVSSGTLAIGTYAVAATGTITQTGGTITTGGGTLTSTGGSVRQNTGGMISGTDLTVNAATGITLDRTTNALSGTVILNNTQGGTPTGNVVFVNNPAITSVSGANGSSGGTFVVTSNTGGITLGAITANGGNVTITSGNNQNIVVGGSVSGQWVDIEAGPAARTTSTGTITGSGPIAAAGASTDQALILAGASVSISATSLTCTGGQVHVWADANPAGYDITTFVPTAASYTIHLRSGPVTYTWNGAVDDDWDTIGNWDMYGVPLPSLDSIDTVVIDATGPGIAPVAPSTFTFSSGGTLTVTSGALTLIDDFSADDITVDGTLVLGGDLSTDAITINGTLSLSTHDITSVTTTLINTGTINFNGAETLPAGVISLGGIVNFAGLSTNLGGGNIATFATLNLNGGAHTAAGSLQVNTALTIDSGVSLVMGADDLILQGDLDNGGTLTGDSLILSGAAAQDIDAGGAAVGALMVTKTTNPATLTGDLTVNGAVMLTAGELNGGTATLKVGGGWSGSGVFNGGSGTVEFTGAAAQAITPATGSTFYNVAKSGGGAATIGAVITSVNSINVTTGGTLTMSDDIIVNSTAATAVQIASASGTVLNLSNNTLTLQGGLTNGAGTGGLTGVTTLILSGAAAQSINAGGAAVGALTVTKTTNPATLTGDLTVNGAVMLTAGELNGGTATLKVGGGWSGSGVFNGDTGTVEFTGTAAQAITPATGSTFYNVAKSGGGTATIGAVITSVNSINVTTGGTLAMSADIIVNSTAATAVQIASASGTALDLNNNALILAGGLTNSAGPGGLTGVTTLTLSGAAAQSINAGGAAVGALTVDKTTDPATLTGDLTVNNAVTLTAGELNGGTVTLNVGRDWVKTGGTFIGGSGTGTVIFNGSVAQAVNPTGSTFNNVTVNNTASAPYAVTLSGPLNATATTTAVVSINGGTLAIGAYAVTAEGDIAQTGGNITTTGTNGELTSNNGSVSQTAGTISGGGLTVSAATGITLENANTVSGPVSLSKTGTGAGNISFTDGAASAVTVTAHNSNTGAGTITIVNPNGIEVGAGDIVNDGTDLVTLAATGGPVTEAGGGIIQGAGLTVNSGGVITLDQSNKIGTLIIIGAGGTVTVTNDAKDLIVGGVSGFGLNSVTISTTTSGTITTSGAITGTGSAVNTGGTVSLSTPDGGSSGDYDITIGAAISGVARVELKSGTSAASTGNVHINAGITVTGDGTEGAGAGGAAVYIYAHDVIGSGSISHTSPGEACLWIDGAYSYTGSVDGNRIHTHFRNGGHLVYRSSTDVGSYTDVPAGTYVYIRADNNLGSPRTYHVASGYNIYIIDVGNVPNANTRTVTFDNSGGGNSDFIEIRGDYQSNGGLTLKPALGGVRLADGTAVTLTGTGNAFSTNGTPLTLLGDTASITAADITLGGEVNGDPLGTSDYDLLLDVSAASGNTISVTGPVGNNIRLGNIEVRSINTTAGAVTFTEAVTAKGYKQTGAGGTGGTGTTLFSAAQDYTEGFSFTGTNLMVNGSLQTDSDNDNDGPFSFSGTAFALNNSLTTGSGSTGGANTVTITNTGTFSTNTAGIISAGGGFSQIGTAGSVSIGANITTRNTTPADAAISFADAVAFAPANNGTVTLNSSAGDGAISITGPVTSAGTNQSLTLNSGTGTVTLSNTVNLSGTFTKSGSGGSELHNNVTAETGIFFNDNSPVNLNTAVTINLSTGTGAGDIAITGSITTGTGRNISFTSGSGNVTVNGTIGTNTDRLGTIQLTSDGAANRFGNAAADTIYAASFTQTGTGTTTFNGPQDYTAGFSFTGNRLTVNNTLETDTGTPDGDGAIAITVSGGGTPLFTVGSSGSILPGGDGGTMTVNGATANNGTITAGNITSGTPTAVNGVNYYKVIDFNGNYTSTAAGTLNGASSTTDNQLIVFRGNAAFGNFNHYGDTVQFSGTTHNVSRAGGGTVTLADVVIDTGNTVNVTSGTIIQDPAANSGAGGSLTLIGTAALNITAGSWYIGPPILPSPWYMLSNPSASNSGDSNYINFGPAFSGGFAGFNGTLTMGNGSLLTAKDFYTQITASGVHEFTLNAPSAASEMCNISASGNVTVNETFVNVVNSTLTMTGNSGELAVRTHQPPGTPPPPRVPDVRLGNFVADGGNTVATAVKINSNAIFAGEAAVIIETNKYLTTYTGARIWLDPDASLTGSKWEQESNSTFDLAGEPAVEFGVQRDIALSPGRTFEIHGSTTWWGLVCVEPGATLKFANYPALHSVAGYIIVEPQNTSGNLMDDGGVGPHPSMILLTRLTTVAGTGSHPEAPGNDDTEPPAVVNPSFWYFELQPDAEMRLDYMYIQYSWAKNRIPLPISGNMIILALYYVYDNSGGTPPYTYTLADPRGDLSPEFDNAIKEAYYNQNWLVSQRFFYSFTEDTNGNGRIDRIRAQAGFDLYLTSSGAFRAGVTGYEIDTNALGTDGGYRVGSAVTNDADCLYIYLKEKNYSDTGGRPVWRVEQNTGKLVDNATKSLEVGIPGSDQPTYTAWDTAPPRINYALTLPDAASPEIYVQFSEPVVISDIVIPSEPINADLTGTLNAATRGDSDILLPLTNAYAVNDLAAASLPGFKLTEVRDHAGYVEDIRSTSTRYSYLYPSPKYPIDWTYDSYEEITGDGLSTGKSFALIPSGSTPTSLIKDWTTRSVPADQEPGNLLKQGTTASPPYGEDTHRVTDLLISVPPTKTDDTQYFVWPLWAKYKDSQTLAANQLGAVPGSGYGYMAPGTGDRPFNESEVIWDFTGKRFLEHFGDILLQARVKDASSTAPDGIVFGFNVPDNYRASAVHGPQGLWLPGSSISHPPFINMTSNFYNVPSDSMMPAGGQLFTYTLTKTQYPASKATVDFFFHLAGGPLDLFAGRLDIAPGEAIPSSWYRLVRPFTFELHDITRQRGGVTILNNVINSAKRERVFLDYRLTKSGRVTVQVFTLDGNLVKALVRESQSAKDTYYRVSWDGTNNGGRPVARGMYFIRIVAPEIDEIRKVMVVK